MQIDQEKCSGCGICIPYCPARAITMQDKKAQVDREACLECGNCARSLVVRCPKGAFFEEPGLYEGARAARKFFSDPMTTHAITRIPGRGTEEVKTNDVTGRVRQGEIGIAIEVGRPCSGASMEQIQKITKALAANGVVFEEHNPLTHLMSDRTTGTIAESYMSEKVVSAIIEFADKAERLPFLLELIKNIAKDLDTVFSLDLITCFAEDGSIPVMPILTQLGICPMPNAKINLGLGRPLAPATRGGGN
ncbi:MAG: 4Fe-4S binding protein [Bacillota bacterium]